MTVERRFTMTPGARPAVASATPQRAPGPPRLRGLAARFNDATEIAGAFVEQIAPGAFRDAIERDDVVCLVNHNPDRLLGRVAAGTLRLRETAIGLAFEVDLNIDDAAAMATLARVRRGDLRGCSFSFTVAAESWQYPRDGLPIRTIRRVARLFDAGPVTLPAYEHTHVSADDRHAAGRGEPHWSVQLSAHRLRRALTA